MFLRITRFPSEICCILDIAYIRNSLETGILEAIAAANGWRLGFQQLQGQVNALVRAWDDAAETGVLPLSLLDYPYHISMPMLARAFGERIARNIVGRRFRPALREAYAYPAFYALKRRHDLPFLSR